MCIEKVHAACQVILSDTTAPALNYAVNYAKAALKMHGEELATQCLYILNNTSRWRHPRAVEVRAVLREYVMYIDD